MALGQVPLSGTLLIDHPHCIQGLSDFQKLHLPKCHTSALSQVTPSTVNDDSTEEIMNGIVGIVGVGVGVGTVLIRTSAEVL